LLSGPALVQGPEPLSAHVRRFGPVAAAGPALIAALEESGLTGRGGAAFPTARKWRAVAAAGAGAVVVVNGAEGEPQSLKDRVLMSARPHLILDGALLAARTVQASQIVVYVGEDHRAAHLAMARAMAERPEAELRNARLAVAPARYVAGESSAVANFVASAVATPTSNPPWPHQGGAGRPPVLVQNVETLAQVALIARYGAAWYRSAGCMGAAGTILVTVAGAVEKPGVIEIEAGTTVREVLSMAGGLTQQMKAVLLGGYFGQWIRAEAAWDLALDPVTLRGLGLTLGCGVVGFLPHAGCGVCETARIMEYLAAESSAQCGPCFFGLGALAGATGRIAQNRADAEDLARLQRWSREVVGRGACRHPDGAGAFLQSALATFHAEFAGHSSHTRAYVA
jgi:NADH:ubiquinone oxidoreductase subunit F (NADH-binding)